MGETLAEAAAREVLEETGIAIEVGPPIPPHDRVVRGADGSVELHVGYNVHWALASGGEPVPGDDVGETAWFTADDLEARSGEVHEDTWRLIRAARLVDRLRGDLSRLPDWACLGP